jgi:hypothetical protein
MSEVQVHIITPTNMREMMEAAKAGDLELCGALDLANEFAGRKHQLCSQCRTKFSANKKPIAFVVIHDRDDAHTAGFCRRCAEDENFETTIDEQLAMLGIEPAVLQ